MSVAKVLTAVWVVSLLVAGCQKREIPKGPQAPVAAPAAVAQPGSGIAWFAGGLEAAFARAGIEKKPVFLYWGAAWCPYCKDLKANVFSRPDFIEKSRLFVPVYLDGDDTGAQKAGEQFNITGYPTVIVLRGDRTELARLGGGMDRTQYAQVLDLVLSETRPANELLTAMASGATTISPDDCRRLAFNAWNLDDGAMEDSRRLASGLQKAAQLCPANAHRERARLTTIAASAAAKDPAGPQFKPLLQGVLDILTDRELATATADALQYLDAAFFTAAKKADPGKMAELAQSWNGVMDAIAGDLRYTPGDRLAAINSKLVALKALDPKGEIPAALVEDAKHRVDAALAERHDEYTRAGVVNAALNTLDTLGDAQRAYEVAKGEVQTSQTPYYYMADLGAIAEELGRKEEALSWFERAYRESKGQATRFQWGTNYINALVRLAPQDDPRIRKAAVEVLGELDGPDRLYKRTRMRLDRLDANLRKWNGGGVHATTVAAIRKRMDGICGKMPAGDEAREACSGFLAKA